MTHEQLVDVVHRQLAAEAAFLEALASFPCILAERRRVLEEAERELADAVDQVLRGDVCKASGSPADGAGFPDARPP